MTHPKDTTPEIFSDGVFFPSLFPRTEEEWDGIFAALSLPSMKRPRKPQSPKPPTLASVAKQAGKAGIEVARYEVKPDGTVVVVTGTPESAEPDNPWPLDEFRTKETKQ
jgi:hypothetical protein